MTVLFESLGGNDPIPMEAVVAIVEPGGDKHKMSEGCNSFSEAPGWIFPLICTRSELHEGAHVAQVSGGNIVMIWEDDE